MTIAADIAWIEKPADAGESQVLAAKLHVLQLEPIKTKLGDKWDRLSSLVHKLFEKTLRQAQGPSDHFLLADEMSYIVTFHNRSIEEASLACASVAKKVCELLFGAEINDITVRGLVGMVSPTLLEGRTVDSGKISEALERHGRQIIVTPRSANSGAETAERAKTYARSQWRPIEWIKRAHDLATPAGVNLGFSPVWDLKNRKSASLFLSIFSGLEKSRLSVRRALSGANEAHIVEMEIALLNAAAEYAHRVHAAHKVCALGVGVSYETLSGFHSRIAYIGALKAIQTIPTCPLLLRVEQVPGGTPMGRLAEIVTMLSVPNVQITIEFQSLRCLPDLDIRLGAVGLGGSLKSCDSNLAPAMVHRLARRATEQRAFVFLHDIDSSELLGIAAQNEVRFGCGSAINSKHVYTGHEPVPDFPLHY